MQIKGENMESRKENGKVYLKFGYNQGFSGDLKRYCGAKWRPETKEWYFDEEFENKANDLMLRRYGYSLRPSPKLNIEFSANEFFDKDTLDIAIDGYTFVYRENDSLPVILKHGGIILQGGFPVKGGSSRYPSSKPLDDTVIRAEITEELWNMFSDETKSKIKRIDKKNKKELLLEKEAMLLKELEDIRRQLKEM